MSRTFVLAAWAAIACLIIGCQAAALLSGGRYGGARAFFDRLTRTNLRLLAVFVGWMWLGWHLFAR